MKRLAGTLGVLFVACCTFVVAARFDSGRVGARSRPGGIVASDAASARANHLEGVHGTVLVAFGTMYGVDGPFVGDANAIRGVPGDELPWEIDGSIRGRLDTDGHLTIRVRGLVFKEGDPVPPEIQGTNDEAEFRGLVSCLTEVGDSVEVANVLTAGFPATPTGDANIIATVALPNPCVAPIVMVLAGSEDKWFAVTGFEAEEDGDDTGGGTGGRGEGEDEDAD